MKTLLTGAACALALMASPALAADYAILGPAYAKGEAQAPAAQGHRAGRDDDDLLAPRPEASDVSAEGVQPGAIRRAGGGVNQQGRADLEHDPPGGRQRSPRSGHLGLPAAGGFLLGRLVDRRLGGGLAPTDAHLGEGRAQ